MFYVFTVTVSLVWFYTFLKGYVTCISTYKKDDEVKVQKLCFVPLFNIYIIYVGIKIILYNYKISRNRS